MNASNEEIRELFNNARHIAIVSHVRPDGDAIGSMLGLANALKEAGKTVTPVLQDIPDEKYAFITGLNNVSQRLPGEADCLIVVDCSDVERTGKVLKGRQPDLVIDHHKTNLKFGRLNLIEDEAEATAMILSKYMSAWGLKINADTANALLTGIVADTLGFRTANAGADCLRVAAELMDKGADLAMVYHKTLLTRTAAEVRYWGQGLTRLNLQDGILWVSLSLDDRVRAGYSKNDDADLINILSSVAEALVTIIFVEQEDGRVKISWRSVEGLDVSQLAVQFGGGGHAAAAGADVKGSLPEVMQAVLPATHDLVNKSDLRYR